MEDHTIAECLRHQFPISFVLALYKKKMLLVVATGIAGIKTEGSSPSLMEDLNKTFNSFISIKTNVFIS